MLFERFEDEVLSHYSYAVGCPAAGSLAIVDPRRDVDVYQRFAAREGLEITHVLETHVHADFASGARELAERTGAELLVSGHDEGETYEVAFAHRDLFDGDRFEIGSVGFEAVHTPGHTPEHISFLVYDGNRSAEVPMLMLSGDFLFVGSLGRPDLLGEEAKRELAERLFESVRGKLADLPDGLEIHPAHGAGSMCGSGMSGRPTSTLGFERVANPYLDPGLDREAFVERILGNVPPFPDYYRRMKRLNADGPPTLGHHPGGLPGLEALPVERFSQLAADGEHLVVDLRDQLAFGGGHVPGSFGIGAGGKLSTWASWVVPYERPILLVGESHAEREQRHEEIETAVRGLVRVGLDRVVGHLDGGMEAWVEHGGAIERTPQVTARQLADKLAAGEELRVVDVREDDEWEAGHVAGAHHLPAGTLGERLDELPEGDAPLVVLCGSGYRSTVAASVLERAGRGPVWNLTGGMRAWQAAGLPVAPC